MKTNTNIVYFLTRSLFLGFGISLTFNKCGKDTYLAAILGMFLGLMITYLYSYIIKKKNHQTLNEIFKKKKALGILSKILIFLASLIILIYVLVIYKIFVVSFLLINTPEIYILIPFIILALYCAFKDLKVINRVASCLLPLSIILVIFSIFSLIGYFETINFLPILNIKPINFFGAVLTFAGISTFPNILTLHLNEDLKGYHKMYILACITLIFALISINGIFGENLVKIFRFPEYMVLKQLKILNFIEKVENILSIAWAFDLFMTAVMAIYSIKELVPKKKNKYTTTIILVITLYIVSKVFASNYVNELRIYYILPIISFIIPLIISIPLLFLVNKKD